jgi:hypothetical protein
MTILAITGFALLCEHGGSRAQLEAWSYPPYSIAPQDIGYDYSQ